MIQWIDAKHLDHTPHKLEVTQNIKATILAVTIYSLVQQSP